MRSSSDGAQSIVLGSIHVSLASAILIYLI